MKTFVFGVRICGVAAGVLVPVTLLLSGCQSHQVGDKSARLIPKEAIIGEWAGFSEEHGFYFMKLQPGGSGLFGYMPYREAPTLLKVSDWQCKEKRLTIELTPIEQNPKGVQKVEGPAGWLTMTLTVSGRNWQRQVVFHREDDREERLSTLKRRTAAYTTDSAAPKQK